MVIVGMDASEIFRERLFRQFIPFFADSPGEKSIFEITAPIDFYEIRIQVQGAGCSCSPPEPRLDLFFILGTVQK